MIAAVWLLSVEITCGKVPHKAVDAGRKRIEIAVWFTLSMGGRTPDCSRFGVGCVSVATILAVQLIKIMVGVVSKCALNGRIFPFFEIGHFHMDMQMTLALTA